MFSSLSPILIDVKHRKQQSIVYYSWTSPVCVDCLSYVFLSSSPIALQITEHSCWLFLGLRRKHLMALLSFQSLAWLVCRHWLWQNPQPLFNVWLHVCAWSQKDFMCTRVWIPRLVLRSPFLVFSCLRTRCHHFAPAVTHHRQRHGFSLSR